MSGFLTRDKLSISQGAQRPGLRVAAELLFQPRFRLADKRLVAIEASALRPRPGPMRPSARELREAGRDVGRDGAMLRYACSLATNYRGAAPPVLSLRITEAQTASGALARVIADVLEETGLPPYRLELEFCEDSLQTDETDLLYLLAALRDLGIGLALGGFGSSVSSLTLLRRRSLAGLLSTLKLHPLLMRELGGSNGDVDFLRAIIATGHALGLLVVAEGVDSAAQDFRLQEAGCDQGLGTWLGEAQPAMEALTRCLETPARAASLHGHPG